MTTLAAWRTWHSQPAQEAALQQPFDKAMFFQGLELVFEECMNEDKPSYILCSPHYTKMWRRIVFGRSKSAQRLAGVRGRKRALSAYRTAGRIKATKG